MGNYILSEQILLPFQPDTVFSSSSLLKGDWILQLLKPQFNTTRSKFNRHCLAPTVKSEISEPSPGIQRSKPRQKEDPSSYSSHAIRKFA